LHSVFLQSLEFDFPNYSCILSTSKFLELEGINVFHLFSLELSQNLVVIGIGIFLLDSEHSLLTEKVDCFNPLETGHV